MLIRISILLLVLWLDLGTSEKCQKIDWLQPFENEANFTCESNGWYPDKYDETCRQYFVCIKNKNSFLTLYLHCPNGTFFNPETNNCVSDYTCRYISHTTQITTTDDNILTESSTPVSVECIYEDDPNYFSCKMSGSFPNYNDITCKSYFFCLTSDNPTLVIETKYNCQQNSYFNPLTQACDEDYICPCINNSISPNTTRTSTQISTTTVLSSTVISTRFSEPITDKITTKDFTKSNPISLITDSVTDIEECFYNDDPSYFNCTQAGIFRNENDKSCGTYYMCKVLSCGRLVKNKYQCREKYKFNPRNRICEINYVCPCDLEESSISTDHQELINPTSTTTSPNLSTIFTDEVSGYTTIYNETGTYEQSTSTETVTEEITPNPTSSTTTKEVPIINNNTNNETNNFTAFTTSTSTVFDECSYDDNSTYFQCSTNGRFRNKNDRTCQTYFLCKVLTTGKIVQAKYACPQNSKFNPKKQLCDTEYFCPCYIESISTTVSTSSTKSTSTEIIENNTTTGGTTISTSSSENIGSETIEDVTATSTTTSADIINGTKTSQTLDYTSVSNIFPNANTTEGTTSTTTRKSDLSSTTKVSSTIFDECSYNDDPEYFSCIENGRFRNKNDRKCQTYFLCRVLSTGKIVQAKYACPQNSKFNPKKQLCDTEYICPCYPESESTTFSASSTESTPNEKNAITTDGTTSTDITHGTNTSQTSDQTSVPDIFSNANVTLEISTTLTTQDKILTTTRSNDISSTPGVSSTIFDECSYDDDPSYFTCTEQGRFRNKNDRTCQTYFWCNQLSTGALIQAKYACPQNSKFNPKKQQCNIDYICPCHAGTVSTVNPSSSSHNINSETVESVTTTSSTTTADISTDIETSKPSDLTSVSDNSASPNATPKFTTKITTQDVTITEDNVTESSPTTSANISSDTTLNHTTVSDVFPNSNTTLEITTKLTTEGTPSTTVRNSDRSSTTSVSSTIFDECSYNDNPAYFSCTEQGRFRNKNDRTCQTYFWCNQLSTGELIQAKYACPQNSKFNPKKQQCNIDYICPCHAGTVSTVNPSSSSHNINSETVESVTTTSSTTTADISTDIETSKPSDLTLVSDNSATPNATPKFTTKITTQDVTITENNVTESSPTTSANISSDTTLNHTTVSDVFPNSNTTLEITTELTTEGTPSTTVRNSDLSSTTNVSSTIFDECSYNDNPAYFSCTEQGRFRNKNDRTCQTYFWCNQLSTGELIQAKYACPQNSKFNPKKQQCNIDYICPCHAGTVSTINPSSSSHNINSETVESVTTTSSTTTADISTDIETSKHSDLTSVSDNSASPNATLKFTTKITTQDVTITEDNVTESSPTFANISSDSTLNHTTVSDVFPNLNTTLEITTKLTTEGTPSKTVKNSDLPSTTSGSSTIFDECSYNDNPAYFSCTVQGRFRNKNDRTCQTYFWCNQLSTGELIQAKYACPQNSKFNPKKQQCNIDYICPCHTDIVSTINSSSSSQSINSETVGSETTTSSTTTVDISTDTETSKHLDLTSVSDYSASPYTTPYFTSKITIKDLTTTEDNVTASSTTASADISNDTKTSQTIDHTTMSDVFSNVNSTLEITTKLATEGTTRRSDISSTTSVLSTIFDECSYNDDPAYFSCTEQGRFRNKNDRTCQTYFWCNQLSTGELVQAKYACSPNSKFNPKKQQCNIDYICPCNAETISTINPPSSSDNINGDTVKSATSTRVTTTVGYSTDTKTSKHTEHTTVVDISAKSNTTPKITTEITKQDLTTHKEIVTASSPITPADITSDTKPSSTSDNTSVSDAVINSNTTQEIITKLTTDTFVTNTETSIITGSSDVTSTTSIFVYYTDHTSVTDISANSNTTLKFTTEITTQDLTTHGDNVTASSTLTPEYITNSTKTSQTSDQTTVSDVLSNSTTPTKLSTEDSTPDSFTTNTQTSTTTRSSNISSTTIVPTTVFDECSYSDDPTYFSCIENGRFRNKNDRMCQTYFLCRVLSTGKIVQAKYACPQNSKFNPKKQLCDTEYICPCYEEVVPTIIPANSSDTTTNDSTQNSATSTIFEDSTSSNTTPIATEDLTLPAFTTNTHASITTIDDECSYSDNADYFSCTDNGRFRNKNDRTCQTYFLCRVLSTGIIVQAQYACPQNSKFNPRKQLCDTEYTCPCYVETVPTGSSETITSQKIENVTTYSATTPISVTVGTTAVQTSDLTSVPDIFTNSNMTAGTTTKSSTNDLDTHELTTNNQTSTTTRGTDIFSTTIISSAIFDECSYNDDPAYFTCRGNGRFRNKNDRTCQTYFLCRVLSTGKIVQAKYDCPQNSKFNPKKQLCDIDYNCPCYSETIPTTATTSDLPENETSDATLSVNITNEATIQNTDSTLYTTKLTSDAFSAYNQTTTGTTSTATTTSGMSTESISGDIVYSKTTIINTSPAYVTNEETMSPITESNTDATSSIEITTSHLKVNETTNGATSSANIINETTLYSTGSTLISNSSQSSSLTPNLTTELPTNVSTAHNQSTAVTANTDIFSTTSVSSTIFDECSYNDDPTYFTCTENGRFRNKNDRTCQTYFLCRVLNTGKIVQAKYACPQNSNFNPTKQLCDIDYICPCYSDSVSTAAPVSSNETTTSEVLQNNSTIITTSPEAVTNEPTTSSITESSTPTDSTNSRKTSTSDQTENEITTDAASPANIINTTTIQSTASSLVSNESINSTVIPDHATELTTDVTSTYNQTTTGTSITATTASETPMESITGDIIHSKTTIITTSAAYVTNEATMSPITESNTNTDTTSSNESATSHIKVTETTTGATFSTNIINETTLYSTSSTLTSNSSQSSSLTPNVNTELPTDAYNQSTTKTANTDISSTTSVSSTIFDECSYNDDPAYFTCTDNGRFRNKNDRTCQTYFLCRVLSTGRIVQAKYACPQNSKFNPKKQLCDIDYTCPCYSESVPTAAPVSFSQTTTSEVLQNNSTIITISPASVTNEPTTSSITESSTPTDSTNSRETSTSDQTENEITTYAASPANIINTTIIQSTPSTNIINETMLYSTSSTLISNSSQSSSLTPNLNTELPTDASTAYIQSTKVTTNTDISSTDSISSTIFDECSYTDDPAYFTCTENGRFRNKNDRTCQTYFLCKVLSSGKIVQAKYACPQNSKFNPKKQLCDVDYICPCYSEIVPTTSRATSTEITTSEIIQNKTTIITTSPADVTNGSTTTPTIESSTFTDSTTSRESTTGDQTENETTTDAQSSTNITNDTTIQMIDSTSVSNDFINSTVTPDYTTELTSNAFSSYNQSTIATANTDFASTTRVSSTIFDECSYNNNPDYFTCSENGRFRNKNDRTCQTYFLCRVLSTGRIVQAKYSCPQNSKFNPKKQLCDVDYICPCYLETVPTTTPTIVSESITSELIQNNTTIMTVSPADITNKPTRSPSTESTTVTDFTTSRESTNNNRTDVTSSANINNETTIQSTKATSASIDIINTTVTPDDSSTFDQTTTATANTDLSNPTSDSSTMFNECSYNDDPGYFTCTENGRFRNKNDRTCQTYFLCRVLSTGRIVQAKYACPQNSKFNPKKQLCDVDYICPCYSETVSTTTPTIVSQSITNELIQNNTSIMTASSEDSTSNPTTLPSKESSTVTDSSSFRDSTTNNQTENETATDVTSSANINNETAIKSTKVTSASSDIINTTVTAEHTTEASSTYNQTTTAPANTDLSSTTSVSSTIFDECSYNDDPGYFTCTENGRFRNKNDRTCQTYFLCRVLSTGRIVQAKYSCPQNSMFNPKKQLCDTDYNCPCYSDNYSSSTESTTSDIINNGNTSDGTSSVNITDGTTLQTTDSSSVSNSSPSSIIELTTDDTAAYNQTTRATTSTDFSSTTSVASTVFDECSYNDDSAYFTCTENGRFRNKNDRTCQTYFLCRVLSTGKIVQAKYSCPQNSKFNPKKQLCDTDYSCPC